MGVEKNFWKYNSFSITCDILNANYPVFCLYSYCKQLKISDHCEMKWNKSRFIFSHSYLAIQSILLEKYFYTL